MNETWLRGDRSSRAFQHGYSLLELSVALLVAMFLLNGMFMILRSMLSTSESPRALSQLQDDARAAMTVMTDVIQQAGYYPNAPEVEATAALPPGQTFPVAGQAVAGGSNAYGDQITVRYRGDSSKTVLDCRGIAIPNGALEDMTFSVQRGPPDNTGQPGLFCLINGIAVPVAASVRHLRVSYGVDSNASGFANTYLRSNQMIDGTSNHWTSVYTVKVSVQFANPLYGQPGQTRPYVEFSRVIGVMSRTGPNVLTVY